jgi:hypothetical protein
MGMDLHSSKNFMIAALRSHMKTPEYVFIIPWLAHASSHLCISIIIISCQMHDHYPWEATNVEKHETKAAFDDAIVITAHGYDKKFIEEFEIRFNKMTGIISSYVSPQPRYSF